MCWGIWRLWTDSLGLWQLMSSLPKAAWLQAHGCSLYNYTHAHSHQHLLNRQLTGRKIISNNLAYHHSFWWLKVTHTDDSTFICDLQLRQQEEGQNNHVQRQQNAICRVTNFRPKSTARGGELRWSKRSSTTQRQPGPSSCLLLTQWVPAIEPQESSTPDPTRDTRPQQLR